MVLFYTTASPGKPSYRRGILDALCYPEGYILRYSYRQKNIHQDVLEGLTATRDEEGVIIFVDSARGGSYPYYPLRRVTIRGVKPAYALSPPPSPRERVEFLLRLGDFVSYPDDGSDPEWQSRLGRFDRARQIVAGRPAFFVVPGADVFGGGQQSVALAWENVVEAVSKSRSFPQATFMRLGHVTRPDEASIYKKRAYEYGQLVYRIRPGRVYKLNVCVRPSGPGAPPGSGYPELEVRAGAGDLLVVNERFSPVVSSPEESSVLIYCKRTIEEVTCTLAVRVKTTTAGAVNEPNPVLFVRVSVGRWLLAWFVVLVFLGSFFVSVDAAMIPWRWDHGLSALFAKLIGAAFLGWAAFLAFRRLPAGQG